MRFFSVAVLTGVVVTLGAAFTRAEAVQPGDFSSMNFFVGTWSCSGRVINGATFSLSETSKMSADGTRLVTRDSSGKSLTELTFDSPHKLWVETSVNNTDGSRSKETSPGWDGDTLIFTGEVNLKGQSFGYRSTTTKISDSKIQQVDELQGPAGWVQFDTASCEKAHKAS